MSKAALRDFFTKNGFNCPKEYFFTAKGLLVFVTSDNNLWQCQQCLEPTPNCPAYIISMSSIILLLSPTTERNPQLRNAIYGATGVKRMEEDMDYLQK
jgi:hypothetical protein